MSARILGLEVTLINDDQPNALIYTKEKLEYGARLFKPTCDFIYNLKEQGFPRMKAISTSLWGALTQKNIFKGTTREDADLELPYGTARPDKIYPVGNSHRVEYHFSNKTFETAYARIGPFLTAYARYSMTRSLFSHTEAIVKIHTDGFLSTKRIPELKIGTKMGQWKIESYHEAVIQNAHNKPIFS